MKALTNILTHMLMLLLMAALATCTTDDGADEVMPMDDGMVQLQVGMSVPNLKITTRAADEGESLSAIKGLCYDEDGTLTKIADATDITSTTFNMRVPVETRIIHFLANLPDDCTLPKVWTTTETDLQNLTTQSENMTYWGCTTFDATPTDCSITFYRNKARISIETAEGASVGTVGIAGVVNAYDTGKLVPYGGAYNFDLSTNDYPTVPTEGFSKSNVMMNTDPLPTQYDVFEHPNTGTSQENSLYAICLIGSKYYKVALGTPDEDGMVTGNYFQIIRNHNYVISVADVDDVDAALGADFAEDAASLAPINDPNISVKDVVDVVVTLSTSTETLDYNNTSISNLVLSVTVPPEVNTLTLNTPGFTIVKFSSLSYDDNGESKMYLVKNNDGSFTVNHPENDVEHTFSFRLKLNDNPQQLSYQLSCTAASDDANVTVSQPNSVTVSLNKVDDNANVYWMGASPLAYNETASKIPILAEKLKLGATVTFEYEKGNDPAIGLQNAKWSNFTSLTTLDLSNSTTTSFTIDETLYTEIQNNINQVYELANAGMVVQGKNVTLKKITIEPAQVENVALTVDPTTTSLYYDSDNTQQITVTVPDDKTLTSLTITPSVDCFTITPATGELTGPTDGVYTYAPDGGVTSVTFTIAPKSGYDFTNVSSSTLTFGGTGVDMNVSMAQTEVTLAAKPAITADADKNTLYYDKDNQTTTVTVNIPKGISALSITATDFTVTQYNNSVGNYDNGTYTLNNTYSEQTVQFVFTMNNVSSTSGKTSTTIEFSDNSGIATSPDPITITLTEEPEEVSSLVVTPVGTTTIDLSEGGNKTVKLTISIPSKAPTNLTIATNYAFDVVTTDLSGIRDGGSSYYYDYINTSEKSTVINLVLGLSDDIFGIAGDYTITIGNSSESIPITIKVVNDNLEEGVLWEGEKAISYGSLCLNTEQLDEYRGKTLKMDVVTSGEWAINIGNVNYQYDSNLQQPDEMTLDVSIPSELNGNISITGKNVIVTKIYTVSEE